MQKAICLRDLLHFRSRIGDRDELAADFRHPNRLLRAFEEILFEDIGLEGAARFAGDDADRALEIELRLKREFGVYPNSVEGRRQAEWILMDYVDFVVHIFLEEKRAFYDLERLWKSARPVDLEELKASLKEKTVAARKKTTSAAKKAATPAKKKTAATKTAAKKRSSAPAVRKKK